MTRKRTAPRKGGNTDIPRRREDGSDILQDPAIPGANDAADHEKLDDAEEYTVGYGRPPRHSQYKPGQSGYPQGRKKRARGPRAIFEMISKEIVTIREGGRTKKMSREEAFQRNLYARAFTDSRAIPQLLILMKTLGATVDEETARELPVTPEHKAIVADFFARHSDKYQPFTEDDPDDPEPSRPSNEGHKP